MPPKDLRKDKCLLSRSHRSPPWRNRGSSGFAARYCAERLRLRSPRAVFRKRHGVRCRHRVIGYFLHAPLEASISPTTQKSYEDPGRLPTRMEGLYTATSTQQQCRRSMRNGSVPSTRAARRDEAIATRSPFGFGNRRPDCLWLWCRVLRRAKKRSRETPEQSRIRRTVSLRQTFAGCIHEQFPPPARLSPCAA